MLPETRIATVTVTANSRNSRPTMPLISSSGMNTATSERLIETMVKPISPAPLSAASSGVRPASMWRTMFSSMTIASSTTKPTAIVEPHQRKVVEAVTEQIHHRECPGQRQRHGDSGDDRRPDGAQKQEDHRDHQDDGDHQGGLHVGDRGADRLGAIGQDRHVDRRGDRRLEMRQRRPHLIDRIDHVGAGLFVDRQQDAPACRSPRRRAWCSRARPPPGRCRGCEPARRCGRRR